MSTTPKDGGSAFPMVNAFSVAPGMTLRDWFAGQALAGLLSNPNVSLSNLVSLARESFDMADALIAARKKGGEV